MNGRRYLLDNNALMALGYNRVRSDYFRDHCLITSDVLWEAGDHRERELLEELTLNQTITFFEYIRAVMREVDVGDTSLIDLYKNQGAADPGLIATVLESVATQQDMLFTEDLCLVSNDAAVVEMGNRFGITTMAPAELAAIFDTNV